MNRFVKYLRIWSKRSFRLLPLLLCFTLLISGCMLILLKGLLEDENSSDKNIGMKIGLVGDVTGTYLDIGITAIKEFDSSRFYVEFLPLEKSEAEEGLKKGELTGYVFVPDNFVDEVISGGNPHLSYVESSKPDAMGPLLTQEIINVVSALVLESRAGVYAMGDLSYEYDLERSDVRQGEKELNLRYFDAILSREEMYELDIMGTGKGLGFADYYSISFILIILMLWGIMCVPLLGTRNTELPCLLYGTGTGCVSQATAEYIPFLIMILINTAILCFGAGAVAGDGFIFSGFRGFLFLLPVSAVITSMQFFLYEITSNVISAVLVQILATLGLAYISGLIYPIGSLPAALRAVGSYTPTGICLEYMSQVFSNDPGFIQRLPLVIAAFIFIILSAFIRKIKIGKVAL